MPDMIHSSHSKKDLLELINTFQIDVPGAGDQSRQRLGINLWNKVLEDMNYSDTHYDAREIHHFFTSENTCAWISDTLANHWI